MTEKEKVDPIRTVARANELQTIGDRIKYLRGKMKPFMTQQQLAYRARVDLKLINKIETNKTSTITVQTDTLRKIAHALDCEIYINIRSKPSLAEGECQLSGPALPKLPKRKGRTSAANRRRALLLARPYQKRYRRRKDHEQHKVTSDKPNWPPSLRALAKELAEAGSQPKPPDRPSQE